MTDEYIVTRVVLDSTGLQQDMKDISKHKFYHHACDALRHSLSAELKSRFKLTNRDIFDRYGELKQNSSVFRMLYNEYDPYRWAFDDRIGRGSKKQITVLYEVRRRRSYD